MGTCDLCWQEAPATYPFDTASRQQVRICASCRALIETRVDYDTMDLLSPADQATALSALSKRVLAGQQ